MAMEVLDPKVHLAACKEAVMRYASHLFTPVAMVTLVLNMWAPKAAFCEMS